jgi:hypothetical protein
MNNYRARSIYMSSSDEYPTQFSLDSLDSFPNVENLALGSNPRVVNLPWLFQKHRKLRSLKLGKCTSKIHSYQFHKCSPNTYCGDILLGIATCIDSFSLGYSPEFRNLTKLVLNSLLWDVSGGSISSMVNLVRLKLVEGTCGRPPLPAHELLVYRRVRCYQTKSSIPSARETLTVTHALF